MTMGDSSVRCPIGPIHHGGLNSILGIRIDIRLCATFFMHLSETMESSERERRGQK